MPNNVPVLDMAYLFGFYMRKLKNVLDNQRKVTYN